MKKVLLSVVLFALVHLPVGAALRVHGLFSDNMVLQQGSLVPVWGWGDEGETVTVQIQGQKARAVVKGGRWMATLRNLSPGGPFELVVYTLTETIRFTNVMVGEVWLCSGQSNMEWPLSRTENPGPAIESATNFNIRFITIPRTNLKAPTNNVPAQWVVCAPESVSNFSAVAYYFGRELQRNLCVPVGLIHSSWGGTAAEQWTSEEALRAHPRLKKEILDAYPEAQKQYELALAAWEQAGRTNVRPRAPRLPSGLYNGMIAPLVPFAFRGVIWYQGESNADRADQYRVLFPEMIRDWRRAWGRGDFPFLYVQLAPYMAIKPEPGESAWAELREAQLLTLKMVKNTAMVVITDLGDERDIHPRRKEPVGKRLALAALGIAYREPVVYSGPMFLRMVVKSNTAILYFDHVGSGLYCPEPELKGFAICGPDRKFVWADARIIASNAVAVSSPAVTNPVAVRYGWADYPVVNLYNKEGLPASPFRTDDFPLITAPKVDAGSKKATAGEPQRRRVRPAAAR